MLRLVCDKSGGKYISISLKGHTGYADRGSDIVCSAVSVLFINTVNSIENFTKDKIITKKTGEGDNQLVEAFFPENLCEGSILLIDSMMFGLLQIEKQYKDNFSVSIKEE